jgi:hypothetical protein
MVISRSDEPLLVREKSMSLREKLETAQDRFDSVASSEMIEMRRMDAAVVAISPQKDTHRVKRRHVPLPLVSRPLFEQLGHALLAVNDSGDWTLPLPATYVIGTDGRVAMSFVDAKYGRRIEPRKSWPRRPASVAMVGAKC